MTSAITTSAPTIPSATVPAPRHFLSLQDFSAAQLRAMLDLAVELKRRLKAGDKPRLLDDKMLAMIFERQSTRTRVSFDVGMRQLGGETMMLTGNDMQLAREETLSDTARVMSRYVDAIMIRILDHDDLLELAGASSVPVINGLTRRGHPCQVLADIMTFEEHRGPIAGKKVAWVGDSNNVMTSWVHATRLFGNTLTIGCPEEFGPDQAMLADIRRAGASVHVTEDANEAVKDADLVIADTWVSMGDSDATERRKVLKPYQVNPTLMARAKANALFMHCLPAHRGDEVTDDVIDGPQSVVFDEAENRLHAQKGDPVLVLRDRIHLMTELQLQSYGLDRPESGDDVVVPFTLENLDCRGRFVRLGEALDSILTRHRYPEPVARLLGEAVVLAALIGSSLKFEGRFILQTQTDGPVNLIVVDLDAPDGLRGYARFDAEAVDRAVFEGRTQPGQLLGKGHLAMTVDQGSDMDRYQGIVSLEGDSLEQVALRYFQQSEQIPTGVRLAMAEITRRGDSRPHWRAGGLLVQHMPAGGMSKMADLPGDGDFANVETADPDFVEDDNWTRVKSLLSTLSDAELADPDLSAERALFRLYHETGVRVFDPVLLEERCTCSVERIEAMLQNSFTAEERQDMAVDGEIEVVCEFCSTAYHFNPHQFAGDEPTEH